MSTPRRAPSYREFAPPAALESVVRRVWTFEGEFDRDHDERIAPDGCPELIFHFGDPYRERSGDGPWTRQAPALLAGNLTRPLQLRARGSAGVLGVRLWPDAVTLFSPLDARDTLDRRFAFRHPLRSALTDTVAVLRRDPSVARVLATAAAVVALLQRQDVARDVPTARAVRAIFTARGQVALEELATRCGVSPRQFERRMVAATGLSPKRLASIVRFRAVFDEVQAGARSAWLQAALASGFFDQAHMIRAFRRFAGQPPRAYLQSAGVLSSALVAPDPAAAKRR